MSNTNRATDQKIANAIGATSIVHVTDQKMGTPLSWLNLAHELKNRLVSSGGRPSDPYWDTKRIVPFRRKVWNFLTSEAKELSRTGRKVGPAQLAAIIIEDSLNKSKQEIDNFGARITVETSSVSLFQSFNTEGSKPMNVSYIPSSIACKSYSIKQLGASSQWSDFNELGNLQYSITGGKV